MSSLPDHRLEVARALGARGARALCEELGIERSKTEKGKYVCPRHGGGALSVRDARDGMVQVRCFGCDLAGDVFTLIAEVRGYTIGGDFRRVLLEAAELASLWPVVDEMRRGDERSSAEPARPRPAAPPVSARRPEIPPPEERTYPPDAELGAVWEAAGLPSEDEEARAMLEGRGFEPARVDVLARVIDKAATLPRWARYSGRSWVETGHRLLLPVYDAAGVMQSVRAWRVVDGTSPKRLPPTGHKAGGLVLADDVAIAMLAGTYAPKRVLVVEGEPDFLTWATRPVGEVTAILGVGSGSWTDELAGRVPSGARVIVRTHHDASGNKYAEQINSTLRGRCTVLRPKADA